MAGLSSAFLYVFALDALLTLANQALYLLTGMHVFGVGVGLLTLALIPWVGLMLALMAFCPRLPKRVLLPVCVLYTWETLGAMPLPLQVSVSAASAIANGLALLLSLAVFRWMKSQTGVYQITDGWLEARGPAFGWGNLLVWGTMFAVLGPAILATYTFLSAGATLSHFTAGFMQLRLDGLYSIERVYERGEQRVHLIGMMHIGQEEFYQDLLGSLPVDGSVILAEGVGDEGDRLGDFNYSRIAEAIHLSEQTSFEIEGGPPVLRADVDAAEFSDTTVDVLNAVGRVLQAETREEALQALVEYFGIANGPEVADAIWHDVLELRNLAVLEKVDEVLAGDYSRAIVPWGALHMLELEPAILERDFTRASETERRIIAF